jgi:hypothetical protein
MKKTIEMLQKEYYYITLYDLIENRLEEIRKSNHWRNLTDARYEIAMDEIAEELGADAEDLKAYYDD